MSGSFIWPVEITSEETLRSHKFCTQAPRNHPPLPPPASPTKPTIPHSSHIRAKERHRRPSKNQHLYNLPRHRGALRYVSVTSAS